MCKLGRDTIEIHAVKIAKHKESDLACVHRRRRETWRGLRGYALPANEGVEVAVEYTVRVPHCAHVEHLGR